MPQIDSDDRQINPKPDQARQELPAQRLGSDGQTVNDVLVGGAHGVLHSGVS